MMIEFGNDDLVAGNVSAAERSRDVKSDRRHVGAERDFIRFEIEKVCERLARIGDQLVGLGAGRISPMRIGIMVEKVITHCFDDLAGDLSSSGTIEISYWEIIVFTLESREMRTDFIRRGDKMFFYIHNSASGIPLPA